MKKSGIFSDRFAVRSASPVRPLRCEIGFACETVGATCVTRGVC